MTAGSRVMEAVAWLGLAMGATCFASSAMAGPPPQGYAALPSPQEITAYVTAICGAILTAANTAFVIWHKLHQPPKRRRRKPRPDAPTAP